MTKRVSRILAATAACLVMCSSWAAIAADFTFRVPVKFYNLTTEASKVRVQCIVFRTTSAPGGGSYSGAVAAGTWDGAVDRAGGVLTTATVTMNLREGLPAGVNVPSGTSANDAKSWRCTAFVCRVAGGTACNVMQTTSPVEWARAKPGTRLITYLSGTL